MNAPKLRFKDNNRKDFPDWNIGTLGDVFDYTNGKSFENEVLENGDYFLVTLNSIDISGKLKTDHKRVNKTDFSLKKNDLVMILSDVAHGNFLGLTDIIPNDRYVLNQRIGGLRAKTNIDVRYASLYINNKQKYFKLHGQGSSQQNLSKGDVLNFILPIPHLDEQTKIASFLTAVDEKITQLTRKYDLLAQYKKGVMQQIFSQTLRFKDDDGRDFPEWKETTLGDIATFFRGGMLSKSDIAEDGSFECVHYGELFTTYSEVIHSVRSRTNLTDTVKSETGDILMPSSDVTPAGLAKASCIQKTGVVLGGDINIIRLMGGIEPIFISYMLNFEKNKIIQLVSGTTVKHIYIKDIKTIPLTLPRCNKEQTKIANFLTAFDDKITHTQTQLSAAKQYKQGLLQQMFV